MDGADLLVVEAVGLGRGDDDRVRPLAEGDEEVQREGADRGGLLDACHLAAIEGDKHPAHTRSAGDQPREGDAVLLDAGLVARGAEGELEAARRPGLREAWRDRARAGVALGASAGVASPQGDPEGSGGGLLRRGLVEDGARRLVSLARRIARRDQDDVLPYAEGNGHVEPDDGLRPVTLVDPGDLDRIQGDCDLRDALAAGDLADDLDFVHGQPRLVGWLLQDHLQGHAPDTVARLQGDHLEVQRADGGALRLHKWRASGAYQVRNTCPPRGMFWLVVTPGNPKRFERTCWDPDILVGVDGQDSVREVGVASQHVAMHPDWTT